MKYNNFCKIIKMFKPNFYDLFNVKVKKVKKTSTSKKIILCYNKNKGVKSN